MASRLVLRWAAKRPQTQTLSSFRKIAVPLLGLLRSPTQGKPARHNSPPAYAAFLQSLRVIWVFDTRANKELALANGAN